MRTPTFVPILALASASLVGCGGGGSSSPTPIAVTLFSVAAIDGGVTGAMAFPSATIFFVGDDVADSTGRSCLAFDLSAIPAGATILSAELVIFQSGGAGAPYAGLGDVLVDHVNLGVALDPSDYAGNTLAYAIGDLSSNGTIELKFLDVTAAVGADVAANRPRADFRLWFPLGTDFDAADDFARFDAPETVAGVPPELRVTYTP